MYNATLRIVPLGGARREFRLSLVWEGWYDRPGPGAVVKNDESTVILFRYQA